MRKPECRCAASCGLWAKFLKFAHPNPFRMKKSLKDYIFGRKMAKHEKPVPERSNPTQEEVDAVDVEVAIHSVMAPVPLLLREDDVWVVFGPGIGLTGSTFRKLKSAFNDKGYSFHHYDLVFGGVTSEALEYNFPDVDIDISALSQESFSKAICEGLGVELPERCILFIRYNGKSEPDLFGKEPTDTFSVFDASASNAFEFLKKALAYIGSLKDLSDSGIRFSKSYRHDDVNFSIRGYGDEGQTLFRVRRDHEPKEVAPPTPDEEFDAEMEKVAKETFAGMEKLILSGYSIDIIESWLNKLSKRSRVVITEKYEILLPDYKNKVVKMNHLPKALYLFFLKHDRGYAIYQMEDQRDELLSIYGKLTNSSEPETIRERIDSLVDKNGKSFTEKCSLIRAAFSGIVPERFIEDYYINGPQGEAKRIKLDRNLVEWRVKI